MASSVDDNIPQWKKDLILRKRAQQHPDSQLSSGVLSCTSAAGTSCTLGPSRDNKQCGQTSSSPSTSLVASSPLLEHVEPTDKCNGVHLTKNQTHCVVSSEKVKMVQDSVLIMHPQLTKIGNGDCCKRDNDSDSSEELQYGPGIVSKLKSKYLSLTLRETSIKPRPSILHMRRATSLENMLDVDSADELVSGGETERVVERPRRYAQRNGNATVRNQQTRYRNTARGNDSVKRARSVETLRATSLNEDVLITEGNDTTNRKQRPADTKILADVKPSCNGTQRVNRPKRIQPIMDETERPPADHVKQTLMLFEGPPVRRTKAPRTTGDVAAKVANFKHIINQEKTTSNNNSKREKGSKPHITPKPVLSEKNRTKALIRPGSPKRPLTPNERSPDRRTGSPLSPVPVSPSRPSPIPDVSRTSDRPISRPHSNSKLSETPDLIVYSSPVPPPRLTSPTSIKNITIEFIKAEVKSANDTKIVQSEIIDGPKLTETILGIRDTVIDTVSATSVRKTTTVHDLSPVKIKDRTPNREPILDKSVSDTIQVKDINTPDSSSVRKTTVHELTPVKTVVKDRTPNREPSLDTIRVNDVVAKDRTPDREPTSIKDTSVRITTKISDSLSIRETKIRDTDSSKDIKIRDSSSKETKIMDTSSKDPIVKDKSLESVQQVRETNQTSIRDTSVNEQSAIKESNKSPTSISFPTSFNYSNSVRESIRDSNQVRDAKVDLLKDEVKREFTQHRMGPIKESSKEDEVDSDPKEITKQAVDNISQAGISVTYTFSDNMTKSHLPRLHTIPVRINRLVADTPSSKPKPRTVEAINGNVSDSPKPTARPPPPPIPSTPPPQVSTSVNKSVKHVMSRPPPKSSLTSREIEKNSINKLKTLEQPVSKVVVSMRNLDDVVANKNLTGLLGKSGSKQGRNQEQTTILFNFQTRDTIPDYIASDGSTNARRGKREKPKPGESGIILLPGAPAEEFTDEDEDWMLSLNGPPSPCDVHFENDNILIDGKSSISKQPKRQKMRIQFDDDALQVFEYVSEASLLEDASTPPISATVVTSPPPSSSNTPGHTVPSLTGSSLASYTPSKMSVTADFQLGVTRTVQPVTTPPSLATSSPTAHGSSETDSLIEPTLHEPDQPVTYSAETTADILF